VPEANFSGEDRFTYRAYDANGVSVVATAWLDTIFVFDPPRAVDDRYGTAVDTPLRITGPYEIITPGAQAGATIWHYNDLGVDLSTAWKEPGYPEFAASRPGPLGYNAGFGSTVNNNTPTVYFRHTFDLADASQVGSMHLDLQRDDGAVVWLNGVEILRSNMPGVEGDGAVGFATPPLARDDSSIQLEPHRYDLTAAELALLRDGPNLLAVEVHNAPRQGSLPHDLFFNVRLSLRELPFLVGLKENDAWGDVLSRYTDTVLVSPPQHGDLTEFHDAGTFVYVPNPGFQGQDSFTYQLRDYPGGPVYGPPATVTIDVGQQPASVLARHLFYNNSKFDGNNAAANAADDGAIASDKTALLPAGTAGFANYTSYIKGLNGVMIDVAGMPGTPTLADFNLRVGNHNETSAWEPAPAPQSLTVRPGDGVGGSDRITLTWPDGAIRRQWLEVTMLSTPATGLGSADVFYFGNAPGETGNSTFDAMVTSADEALTRLNARNALNPAPITWRYDINRDGVVGASDQALVRLNGTNAFGSLNLFILQDRTASEPGPPAGLVNLSAAVTLDPSTLARRRRR
jgi:hypothetical protein